MADIESLPISVLRDDLSFTKYHKGLCELALAYGMHEFGNGVDVAVRLADCEVLIIKIENELKRREQSG